MTDLHGVHSALLACCSRRSAAGCSRAPSRLPFYCEWCAIWADLHASTRRVMRAHREDRRLRELENVAELGHD